MYMCVNLKPHGLDQFFFHYFSSPIQRNKGYCERFYICWVPICVDFVVDTNHEIKFMMQYIFFIYFQYGRHINKQQIKQQIQESMNQRFVCYPWKLISMNKSALTVLYYTTVRQTFHPSAHLYETLVAFSYDQQVMATWYKI